MSTKQEPLFSRVDVIVISEAESEFPRHWRDGFVYAETTYEAARAKDAELIQRLVDGLQQIADEGHWTPDMNELLNAAAAAGFKPSDQ